MKLNHSNEDLKKQVEFVESLKSQGFDFPLIAAEAFVRGMRDSGYRSTATAIREFVDNSIQAQADSVDVVMGYLPGNGSKKKIDAIAVVDNGHGMEPDVIRMAVLWGGTHRENDRTGFGRYGFGLPSAAVSISKTYSVYSRIPGGEWYEVRIDLDEIASGRLSQKGGVVQAPPAAKKSLPEWVKQTLPHGNLDHGTVILLDSLDRLSPGFITSQSFHAKMQEDLGLIYRGLLRNVQMRVIDQAMHEEEWASVDPIDPLFLTPGARYYDDNDVTARELPSKQFKVREKGSRDKTLGSVSVRYSFLPDGFQSGSKARLNVMKENNGLIVMRAGRQIDVLTKPWDYTMVNYDRNWAIELDFEPTLDKEFGVTTNKQQIVISERMWDILEDQGVKAAIEALRSRYREEKQKNKAARDAAAEEKRRSEEAMAEAQEFKTRKPSPPTPEKEKQSKERLKKEAEKKARETGRPANEIEVEISGQPYKVAFENLPGAPFYRLLQYGGQKRLNINTGHRFYSDVYEGPSATPDSKTALELLLFVLGECEIDSDGNRERFYVAERAEWSRRIEVVLDILNSKDPVEDAESAETEEEETTGEAAQADSANG